MNDTNTSQNIELPSWIILYKSNGLPLTGRPHKGGTEEVQLYLFFTSAPDGGG